MEASDDLRDFNDSNTASAYLYSADCEPQWSREGEEPILSPGELKLSDDAGSDRARGGNRSRHESKRSRHKAKKKKHKRRNDSSGSSYSRSRSRSRSRGRHRHSRRHRRSRSRSSGSHGGYSDSERYRGGGGRSRDLNCQNQYPTNTIMIRGLPIGLTEKEIGNDLVQCGVTVKEIRLIRHRDTGLSRGFCFLEFHEVAEAENYMDLKKGTVVYQDEYAASMIYSVGRGMNPGDRESANSANSPAGDWYCSKCSSHNFKRRDCCYRCQALKSEDGTEVLKEELSKSATTTLLLQNLDMLSTEDSVQHALEFRLDLGSIPTKSIKISREAGTNLSRGICFVETNTVSDAVRLYDALIQNPLQIDDKILGVAYCKPPVQAVSMNSAAAAALAAAQWSTTITAVTASSSEAEIRRLAEYSASLYAKTPEEKASYLTYYLGYYRDQHSKGEKLTGTGNWDVGHTSGTVNNSGETNELASNSTIQAGDLQHTSANARAIAPDLNRLQFDTSSGYYYDPVTLLYYDSNTERYYDSLRQEFLSWDSKKGIYVADAADAMSNQQDPSLAATVEKEKVVRTSKIKVSKSVLKDTLQRAVSFNEKKYTTTKPKDKEEPNYLTSVSVIPKSTVKDLSEFRESKTSNARLSGGISNAMSIVEAIDREDSDEEVTSRRSPPSLNTFQDLEKLACTLCKRQFPNLEVLQKHTQMSELHKTNLANLSKTSEIKTANSSFMPNSYRDRAKERRNFFGPEDTEPKNTLKQKYMEAITVNKEHNFPEHDQPPALNEDNVGSRLLKKMGWKSGKGLGKHETGRTDIIQTEMRAQNAGLGLPTSQVVVSSDKDRYSKARHLTLARYRELDEKI